MSATLNTAQDRSVHLSPAQWPQIDSNIANSPTPGLMCCTSIAESSGAVIHVQPRYSPFVMISPLQMPAEAVPFALKSALFTPSRNTWLCSLVLADPQ
ncbi:unnamed protein product [Cercospora beticola]|nr:unnamed protein product [Cercospora beticola]